MNPMRIKVLFLLFFLLTSVSYAGELEDKLSQAADAGNVSEVNRLLEQGVEVNAQDNDGATALMLASQNGHLNVVKALLEKGADVNAKANEGETALMVACDRGHMEVVKALLDKNADVNVKANGGTTALMVASTHGHLDMVKALLESGAEVNAKTGDGRSALNAAEDGGYQEIVKLLEEANVNNASTGEVLLHTDKAVSTISEKNQTVSSGKVQVVRTSDWEFTLISAKRISALKKDVFPTNGVFLIVEIRAELLPLKKTGDPWKDNALRNSQPLVCDSKSSYVEDAEEKQYPAIGSLKKEDGAYSLLADRVNLSGEMLHLSLPDDKKIYLNISVSRTEPAIFNLCFDIPKTVQKVKMRISNNVPLMDIDL
jgi:uncharacterized protein